ncbi:MAG: NAD(P)/FAD-dependent oxidoreductase [Frankiales bacterium]|nr:NAD(P)/FAD-dependent oxidoreductase [Frankiales bacterium]
MTQPLPSHTEVLVVGTGFGGLCTAIKLRAEGRQVVVVEKAHDVGGTWRDNTYPACACDVPSHLYSFSFAPNPDWTRTFGPQGEIHAYLRKVADDYAVRALTWFGTEVLAQVWEGGRWAVRTTAGDITADVVILATGGLSTPAIPDIEGLSDFQGTWFHSAQWDRGHDFAGERVAVIGTGASAIQFGPEVAKQASRLTVFQRTAPWILPRADRAIRPFERRLFRRFPLLQKAIRGGIYAIRESWVLGFRNPRLMNRPEQLATSFIAKHVSDPVLRDKVTPRYRFGCKRVLLSNTWYPMLAKEHVDLVTDAIVRVTQDSIVTRDAEGALTEHPVDTILLGTGFTVIDQPIARITTGRDGRTLTEAWAKDGMRAYQGLMSEGFPNLFMLSGPNTGQGHTSVVYVIERQVAHIAAALRAMDRSGVHAIDPRPQVMDRYNEKVQRMLAPTVWNAGGCSSWYLDESGRNPILWPTFTFTMARELARFDLGDYVVDRAS